MLSFLEIWASGCLQTLCLWKNMYLSILKCISIHFYLRSVMIGRWTAKISVKACNCFTEAPLLINTKFLLNISPLITSPSKNKVGVEFHVRLENLYVCQYLWGKKVFDRFFKAKRRSLWLKESFLPIIWTFY